MYPLVRGGEDLAGRETELARLVPLLAELDSANGRVVLISGEPGIGKTSLVSVVLAQGVKSGARGFVGRCFEQHTNVPYFPFTELILAIFNTVDAEYRTEVVRRLPELTYLLPELQRTDSPGIDTEGAQLRLFRVMAELLAEQAAVSPLVLAVEDLHWADASSLGLFLFIARHLATARILLIGTYRDAEMGSAHALDTTVRELVRERLAEEVQLTPLDRHGTATLIAQKLAISAVPDDLVAAVDERAHGNPFFVEEWVKALISRGSLRIDGNAVSLAATDAVEVPSSLRSIVRERIGRLPEQSQDLLRLASLLGAEFGLDSLIAASGRPEDEVLDAMDPILEAQLLRESPGSQDRYSFAHVLVQQALYEEIPAHRRRRMHRSVGESLATLPRTDISSSTLARHFHLGGDAPRAARYATDAGDDSSSRYAHAETIHHYEMALDLLNEEQDRAARAEIQCRLASELYDTGRLAESLELYQSALGGFARLKDPYGQARAHWGIARVHHGRYDMASAEQHVDVALELWPPNRQDADLVRVLVDASRIKSFQGAIGPAIALAERGVELADQLGDTALAARAIFGLASARTHTAQRPRDALPDLDRGIALARQSADWRTLSVISLLRANHRAMLGDLELELEDRRQAVEAAERAGEASRVSFAYQPLASVLTRLGRWDEARVALRKALLLEGDRLARRAPGSGLLAWLEGRHQAALDEQLEFVAAARQRRDLQGVLLGLGYFASEALQLNRPGDAEAPAREAFLLARAKWRIYLGHTAGHMAEALAILDTADARQMCSEAEDLVEASGLDVARPQLLRARALLCERDGDPRQALELLQLSAEIARSQHAVIELAQTLALLAEMSRRSGNEERATGADAERAALVEAIGPEARLLAWGRTAPEVQRFGPSAHPTVTLTQREREVASLVRGGMSNRQIATSLVISERTVEHHVSNILTRLGLQTRAQLAVWAVEHQITATTD